MPFVFRCGKCRSVIHEDPKPELDVGSYKHQTYLESVLTKLGGTCPSCGHKLQIPPLEVEVLAVYEHAKHDGTKIYRK